MAPQVPPHPYAPSPSLTLSLKTLRGSRGEGAPHPYSPSGFHGSGLARGLRGCGWWWWWWEGGGIGSGWESIACALASGGACQCMAKGQVWGMRDMPAVAISFFFCSISYRNTRTAVFLGLQSLGGQVLAGQAFLGAHESARFLLLRNGRLTTAPSFYDEPVLDIGHGSRGVASTE